jgi:hypothetical protein
MCTYIWFKKYIAECKWCKLLSCRKISPVFCVLICQLYKQNVIRHAKVCSFKLKYVYIPIMGNANIQRLQLCIFYFIAHTYWSFHSVLSKTSRNTRRCSAGPQNKVRIHGSDLTLTYFCQNKLLTGCLATHRCIVQLTNNNTAVVELWEGIIFQRV